MGEDGKWEIARVLYLPMTGLARGWQTAVGSIHMPFNNLLPFHEFSKQTCVMSQTLSCKNSLHCCCFPIPHQIVQHGGVLFSQSHEMSRPSKGCPLWYLLLLLLLLLASQKVYLEFWGTGGGKQPLLSDLVSPQLTIDPSLCPPLFNWLGWPGPDQTVHKKDSYSCPPSSSLSFMSAGDMTVYDPVVGGRAPLPTKSESPSTKIRFLSFTSEKI